MSYMSKKSILSEGILDYIVKKFFLPRALKKDKGFQKKVKALDKAVSDFEKAANAELAAYKKAGMVKKDFPKIKIDKNKLF